MSSSIRLVFVYDQEDDCRVLESVQTQLETLDSVEETMLGDDILFVTNRAVEMYKSSCHQTVPDGADYLSTMTPFVSLRFAEGDFENVRDDDTDSLDALCDVLRVVWNGTAPRVAYAIPSLHQSFAGLQTPPVTEQSFQNRRLEYLPWIVVLPPALVETYGRETVQSAPVYRAETLDDGSILVITNESHGGPTPEKPYTDAGDHIGVEAWFDRPY
ncbi:hypothetical protein [Haloarchaeobius sp. DFWS5]|uniref:hypothetical protein n=1 Tax=Haloarchaeobius sp. DFWS5 TaxID=3446114 RepID=UPI003EBBF1DF